MMFISKYLYITIFLFLTVSLDFFKSAAKKHGASYQAMIRQLLDYYVIKSKNFKKNPQRSVRGGSNLHFNLSKKIEKIEKLKISSVMLAKS